MQLPLDTREDPIHSAEIARIATAPPIRPTIAVGETLACRYLIAARIGSGGTSTVYAADDTRLKRPVALKVLSNLVRDPKRFAREEARLMSSVRNAHVVAVHDLLLTERGPVIVMELVEGETLDTRMERPMSVEECLTILSGIAAGLDAVHGAGLVHGDIKPSNVLIDTTKQIKLTDFGLRAMLQEVLPGNVVGTPCYLAPECIAAASTMEDRQSSLSAESDIYSFAVMAFEMMAGQPPFLYRQSSDYFHAHTTVTAPVFSAKSGMSTAFDAIFAAALAKDPNRRPLSAGAFVRALDDAARGCDERGQALRILVVDDDDDLRALLSEYLGGRLPGAQIETANDGTSALTAMQICQPHVAFVDLGLPGVSGLELLRSMAALQPECRLVVITGHGSGVEWQLARALGVRKFMIKPVAPNELVAAVMELA